MAATHIPFIYRLIFTYIEPLGALGGAALLLFNPHPFLTTMSPTTRFEASNQVMYQNLAATYVLFAFNEAVLLRVTRDLRVWKTLLLGILLCDTVHLYASRGALGPDVFWNPALWRWEDVVNLGSLWGQGVLRVAFVLGVGLSGGKGVKRE